MLTLISEKSQQNYGTYFKLYSFCDFFKPLLYKLKSILSINQANIFCKLILSFIKNMACANTLDQEYLRTSHLFGHPELSAFGMSK